MFGSIHANHVDQSGLEVYNIIFTSYRCGIYIYMWYIYILYAHAKGVSWFLQVCICPKQLATDTPPIITRKSSPAFAPIYISDQSLEGSGIGRFFSYQCCANHSWRGMGLREVETWIVWVTVKGRKSLVACVCFLWLCR